MLNAQKAQYGLQNRQQGLQAFESGIRPQFSYQQTPEQEGVWQKGERLAGTLASTGIKALAGGF
jgi:hypothetical protein